MICNVAKLLLALGHVMSLYGLYPPVEPSHFVRLQVFYEIGLEIRHGIALPYTTHSGTYSLAASVCVRPTVTEIYKPAF